MNSRMIKRAGWFATPVLIMCIVFLALTGNVQAQTGNPGEASGDGVEPFYVAGNPDCGDIGYGYGFKIENSPNGTFSLTNADGELTGGAPSDAFNSVTISNSDGYLFDWSATLGVDAVIVKGGPNADAFIYNPEDTADSRLHPPVNPNNGQYYGISHIEFCYAYALTASKTANAEFTREYDWTISKDPDGAYKGFIGDPAFDHEYVVKVDQSAQDSGWKVTGLITVNNPTPFTVGFNVVDNVDGNAAAVNCTTSQLAPGASTSCSYSASLNAAIDGTNTATVNSLNAKVDGATATADYIFGDPTSVVGYPSVTVSDDHYGTLGKVDGDKTFTYDGSFQCPTDPKMYVNGVYTMTSHINTAEIEQTAQTDSATVDLTCYAPVLSKDATASYVERHTWDVVKVVDIESQGGLAGDMLPWRWTVTVSEEAVEESFLVSGRIDVANPAGAPDAMTVSLVDRLDDGTFATVDCGSGETSVTVAAGTVESCTYTAEPGGRTATENKVVGTFNDIEMVAYAPVTFEKTVSNDTATVTDAEIGLNESLTAGEGPWIFNAKDSHTCSTSRDDYFVDGVYTQIKQSVENWAYVYSGNELQDKDDATTIYTCDAGFVDLYKTVDGEPADAAADFSFDLYSVDAKLETLGTLGNGAGLAFQTVLVPGARYSVCESPVPAGYIVSAGLGGVAVPVYAGPPGEPNPTGEVQCFDFVASTTFGVTTFDVENTDPPDLPPSIEVTKTASPVLVPAPGAEVTFSVTISNTGSTDVTINSLTDDIYGDIASAVNADIESTTCVVPQTIVAGGSYDCSFKAMVNGPAGTLHRNTVTGSGEDVRGREVSDDDDAVVSIFAAEPFVPGISVEKTAGVSEVVAPGADVTFSVRVDNTGNGAILLNTLSDSIYGNIASASNPAIKSTTCALPQTLVEGGTYTCSFVAPVTGSAGTTHRNVVTGTGTAEDESTVTDNDDATVQIVAPPSIKVTKTANPTLIPAPGSNVVFTVDILNNGNGTVTINSLMDDQYGNIANAANSNLVATTCKVPQTIEVGKQYSCTFTAYVGGAAGSIHRNVVTANGTGTNNTTVSGSDDAIVSLFGGEPESACMPGTGEPFITSIIGSGMGDANRLRATAAVKVPDYKNVVSLYGQLVAKDTVAYNGYARFTGSNRTVFNDKTMESPAHRQNAEFWFGQQLTPTNLPWWKASLIKGTKKPFQPRAFLLYPTHRQTEEYWNYFDVLEDSTKNFVYWEWLPTQTYEIALPGPLPEARQITVQVALVDNDKDSRPVQLTITAGSATFTTAPTGPSDRLGLLNIITAKLNAPIGTDKITITLNSPMGTGDSVTMVGVTANFLCVVEP